MAYESGSDRRCGRCGSHVGSLAQCPRCGVPQIQQGGLPVSTPGTGPTPAPGGGDEPDRLRPPAPAWRRAPALAGAIAAVLTLALAGWIVVGRTGGDAAAGGGADQAEAAERLPESASDAQAGENAGPESDEAEPGTKTDSSDTDGSDTDETGDTEERARWQAKEVNRLLSSSTSARSGLSEALDAAARCESAGPSRIEEITESRRTQLSAARSLTVSALTDGAQLKDALVTALDASYQADRAFLAWARKLAASGCPGAVREHRDYLRGLDWSRAAQEAKARFARSWRPIAETYDLTAWKADQI